MNVRSLIVWIVLTTIIMPIIWALTAGVLKSYVIWENIGNVTVSIERGAQIFLLVSAYFLKISFLLMLPSMVMAATLLYGKRIKLAGVILIGIIVSILVTIFTPMVSSVEMESFVLYSGMIFINFIVPYLILRQSDA